MFDKGLDSGLLAQLNKEGSCVQAAFVADNEEDDVQDFNDADSQATVAECANSHSEDEEVVDVDSADEESAYAFLIGDDNKAVDDALGLS
ncbi:hypothetical protein ABBQ38_002571 [Trebouxia sp. C0009 RCD-2024]